MKTARDRHKQIVKDALQRLVAPTGQHRHIDAVAGTGAFAYFIPVTGAGINAPLMRGEIEHAGIAVEDGVRAVAVMHVEIDNQHPIDLKIGTRRGRRNGNVVEQTKTFAVIGEGVMSRRADQRKGILDLAPQHRFDARDDCAGSQQGGVIRSGRDVRLVAQARQAPAAAPGDGAHAFDVTRMVHPR